MLINTQSISRSKGKWLDLDLNISPKDMPIAFEGYVLAEPIKLQGQLLNEGEGTFRLTAQLKVSFSGRCARCLIPVDSRINHPVAVVFILAGSRSGDTKMNKGEDEADDAVYFYSGHVIDISQAVRDELLLALPQRLICRADCRGICPECGQDLNQKQCGCAGDQPENVSPFDRLRELL